MTIVPKELPLKEYPDERDHLVMAFFGEGEDFYSMKGACDLVAENMHLKFRYVQDSEPFLHPYQTYTPTANTHQKTCDSCGYAIGGARNHTFSGGKCTTCGYTK